MKTRIIQSLPDDPAESTKTVAETGTDVPRSNNLAARMGRWSASHRKTATFGWLAFVVAAFAVGIAVPMQTIEQEGRRRRRVRQGQQDRRRRRSTSTRTARASS